MITMFESKAWAPYETDLFSGLAPVPARQGDKPHMLWKGGRISMTVWQQILAFFLEYRTNEVQVRLFYNTDTKAWAAHAFPQQYPTGMTTRELPDHANFEEDMKQFMPPWIYIGTVHHHCSAGAFQSGTDRENEDGIVGIHITVGKLNDPILDIHGRVCIKFPGETDAAGAVIRPGIQQFYDVVWMSWFELPDPVSKAIPYSTHEYVLTTMLKTPVTKEVGFPTRWSENLIRFQGSTSIVPGSTGRFVGDRWVPWSETASASERGSTAYGLGVHHQGRLGLQERGGHPPRGSLATARAVQSESGRSKAAPLRSATEAGMSFADHRWAMGNAVALMEPVTESGQGVVAYHLDVEANYGLLECSSVKEAEDMLVKLGFQRTDLGTWANVEDVVVINRLLGNPSSNLARAVEEFDTAVNKHMGSV